MTVLSCSPSTNNWFCGRRERSTPKDTGSHPLVPASFKSLLVKALWLKRHSVSPEPMLRSSSA